MKENTRAFETQPYGKVDKKKAVNVDEWEHLWSMGRNFSQSVLKVNKHFNYAESFYLLCFHISIEF